MLDPILPKYYSTTLILSLHSFLSAIFFIIRPGKESQILIGLFKPYAHILHPIHQSNPLNDLPKSNWVIKINILENWEDKTNKGIEMENEISRLFVIVLNERVPFVVNFLI